jgi:hypothetical protein
MRGVVVRWDSERDATRGAVGGRVWSLFYLLSIVERVSACSTREPNWTRRECSNPSRLTGSRRVKGS